MHENWGYDGDRLIKANAMSKKSQERSSKPSENGWHEQPRVTSELYDVASEGVNVRSAGYKGVVAVTRITVLL